MPPTPPQQFYFQSIEDKDRQARKAVRNVIRLYGTTSIDQRKGAASEALQLIEFLFGIVPPTHRPGWMNSMQTLLGTLQKGHNTEDAAEAFVQLSTKTYPEMEAHRWVFDDSEAGYDFDEIFNRYQRENKLPELFDEIVKWMQQIIESRAIDSVKAIEDMKQIIATLKASRDGSYFAKRGAWSFVVSWFKNTSWEFAGDVPVLGPIVRSLRKTLEDGNQAWVQIHEEMQKEIETTISADFQRIEYQPTELPKIEYEEGED